MTKRKSKKRVTARKAAASPEPPSDAQGNAKAPPLPAPERAEPDPEPAPKSYQHGLSEILSVLAKSEGAAGGGAAQARGTGAGKDWQRRVARMLETLAIGGQGEENVRIKYTAVEFLEICFRAVPGLGEDEKEAMRRDSTASIGRFVDLYELRDRLIESKGSRTVISHVIYRDGNLQFELQKRAVDAVPKKAA